MPKKKRGRKKGGRNRGYFFRPKRGWFARNGDAKFVPLCYDDGQRIRNPDESPAVLREAYQRWQRETHETASRAIGAAPNPITVEEIVLTYLDWLKLHGAPKTYTDRSQTLFDFASGLPPRFCHGRSRQEDREHVRIHQGFGSLPAVELSPLHIDQWIAAHKDWTRGGYRSRIQAVKRALNYAAERKMLAESPLKGYKVPRANPRRVYITPEQEALLLKHANSALACAVRICIRTGARPGDEFAHLEARHVRDYGERIEWVFPEEESKTRRLRIIRVTDPFVMEETRKAVKLHPQGRLFHSLRGSPWSTQSLKERFRSLLRRVEKKEKAKFEPGTSVYACRHTYARRTLTGYWTGKPIPIEILAQLMGNSVHTCRDHYLQWCEAYTEVLWESA
jgi:integrase